MLRKKKKKPKSKATTGTLLAIFVTLIVALVSGGGIDLNQTGIQDILNSQITQNFDWESLNLDQWWLKEGEYRVQEVVDGDTLKILINDQEETIRLIGIDTPETKDPRKPVQCFGKEASNAAKTLLEGKVVTLEMDPSQGERDKYNRLLAYIILPNGENFNKKMITEGYAHEYTYDIPYKYQKEFKEAEAIAKATTAGLWNPGTCDGDTSKATN
jgi:micrococcal nuclease